MKYYKKKNARFSGISFYIIMAVCMIAVGFAAYSAMDAARMNNNSDDTSYSEYSNSQDSNEQSIILEPVNPNEEESLSNEATSDTQKGVTVDVENETKEPYFTSPLEDFDILKEFSSDTLQFSATYNDMRLHTGVDLVPFENLLVLSCADGTVTSIDQGTVMGTVITVDHGNNVYIRYCGVKNVKVEVGATVSANTALAEIGTVTSECADQAHLHLEVLQNGNPVDPLSVIPLG